MSNYRRARVPGATYFFTVNLLGELRHPQVLQQFNRFLLSHQAEISALKQKYQLTDSLPQ